MATAEKYSGAVKTNPGFEDVAAAEVTELIGAKAATAKAGIVRFQARNPLDLCKLCYLSQSASSIFLLRQKAAAATASNFERSLRMSPFDLGAREHAVFGKSGDLPGSLAYLLLRASGYAADKSLFDPFTRSGSIAIEAALFSSGFPVNYYRKDAFSSYFLQLPHFSKIDFGKFFAAVEKEAAATAARRLNKSKLKILSSSPLMQSVRFAEKNAKIAGVNKLIKFSRLDVAWLDAKLAEHSVDLVVSYPPQFKSGNNNFVAAENEKLKKMYKEFFYHADFFLKKDGSVIFLLKNRQQISAAAADYKFSLRVLRAFSIGSEEFELVRFSKV